MESMCPARSGNYRGKEKSIGKAGGRMGEVEEEDEQVQAMDENITVKPGTL